VSGRTFPSHADRHELHGVTLVVDTDGPEIFIGRCDDISDAEVILLDVDRHVDGEGGRSKAQFVERAAQVGPWKRHQMVSLPRSRVLNIRKLGDL
jgi:hypothetical protein